MNPRILIVDDSLTVRMDIGDALEDAGFEPALCADLRSARTALSAGPCHLVVLDILLPDGDGLAFLQELKSSPATAKIPVLLLSTEAEVRSRVRGMGAGADEYIGKPYDINQVVARTRALTSARTQKPTGPERRILLIDDGVTYRHELKEALQEAGYAVFEAASGEEGLGMIAAVHPDALIVDGMLPGIDGATVVRRLKSDASLRTTPCLLLTAAEGSAEELRAFEAGADAYVRKSEDQSIVLLRLAALLRTTTTPPTAASSLLGPKRLLAVDDSVTYLNALASQLRQEGYDVVLATSGEEALEYLAAQPVDCILLDLIMPGLSGQETCRRIKQTPDRRDIPLVMLTARDDREWMIEGINAGADDFIAKSADFEVLKARLRAQLRRKHFEDEHRKIREELVRGQTEARFQRLVDDSADAIIGRNLDGVVTSWNKGAQRIFGYSAAEMIGQSISVLFPEDRRDEEARLSEQLAKDERIEQFETVRRKKDGQEIDVSITISPVRDSAGQVIGVSNIARDISELKRIQRQLIRAKDQAEATNRLLALAKDQAEQASRAKSSFLANMSHELRTPLNAIIGFAEILLDEEAPGELPQLKEFIGDILTSGRHLLMLINDVLDLSKIEAGKLQFQPEPIKLAELVGGVINTLRAVAVQKRVRIETDIHLLDGIVIDPARLKQVLYNYISNALKFTPEAGRIYVRAHAVEPDMFRLEVEDTGIGIAEADLGRLFADFQQLDTGLTKKHAGTGLGLALTKRLVEAQGGRVGVLSTVGKGSTFYAVLPRRPTNTGFSLGA